MLRRIERFSGRVKVEIMGSKALGNLRKAGILFLLSFGVFMLRALLAIILAGPILNPVLVTPQWWEGDILFRRMLWMVASDFGQVIGILGVGVYCGRFYQKPITYGIIIVCASFLFYFFSLQLAGAELYLLLLENFFVLAQAIIFILAIAALLAGNRIGRRLRTN